ncbi:MAG: amidohydrolase family protein [Candidatus Acidiferrales bacterium]
MKLGLWIGPVPVGCAVVVLFWAMFSTPRGRTVEAAEETLVLAHATIYASPTEAPIKDGVIVVRGGKIAAVGAFGSVEIPAGAKVESIGWGYVTAGFQNSHVHFEPGKWDDAAHTPAVELERHLKDLLGRYGVTTAVDLGSSLQNTLAIRKRIESGEVAGPRILTAGGPLFPPDGVPYYVRERVPADILKFLAQPGTAQAAVEVVDGDLDGGADLIKLFTGSLVERGKVKPMPQEVATAAVAEAHRRGKLVFSHPSNLEGLMIAMNAGVDVLAHTTPMSGKWDDGLIAQMKMHHMGVTPTLQLWISEAKAGGDTDEEALKFADAGAQEMGAYARAGGQILFGTDVGYTNEYSPQREYELMARGGLTPMQILASLTTAPAERFGEAGRRGRIAVGMDADFVVLAFDPTRAVSNFARVCATYREGRPIYHWHGTLEVGEDNLCGQFNKSQDGVHLLPMVSTEPRHP